MCRVGTFLCGCSLKAGTISASVLTVVVFVYLLIMGGLYSHAEAQTTPGKTHLVVKVLSAYYIFNAVLLLVAAIVISIGLIKEKSILVLFWLIIEMIHIPLASIFILCCFIFSSVIKEGLFVTEAFGFASFLQGVIGLAANAFGIYLWIIVLNFYRELKQRGYYSASYIKAI